MEEIKVGEYIRTPYGTIEKVEEIVSDDLYRNVITENNGYTLEWLKYLKTKHSPNIIDLIEEGDYVNGMKVQEIIAYGIPQTIICIGGGIAFPNSIKSIVTKEQFNQMKYIVGE